MALTIENLSTPRSTLHNGIGFQEIVDPAADGYPYPDVPTSPYTLHGNINVTLHAITFRMPDGTSDTLSAANAWILGKIKTNGSIVTIGYDD